MNISELQLIRENRPVKAWIGIYPLDEARKLDPGFLDAESRQYYDRLEVEKRRIEFIAGQYLLRSVVGKYLGAKDFVIKKGAFTQPIVQSGHLDTPAASLSHSGQYAVAIAFPAGHPMGIDIEVLDQSHARSISMLLTDKEIADIAHHHTNETDGLIHLWSMKEAVSKATLCGLMVPPATLELEEIKKIRDGIFVAKYKCFRQYHCYSKIQNGYVTSLTMPFKTELTGEFPTLT